MDLVYFIVVFVALGESAEFHHRFGYKSEEQLAWRERSAQCAGRRQSPIHIVSHRAVPLPLPALETVHFHDLLPAPICLTNTGHSVSLSAAWGAGSARPQVLGAVLDGSYTMESLHFHWGHRNSRGSEHVLSGIRFPLEMHIIHRKTEYEDVREALQHQDGLTVLAFFFQARERRSRALEPLLRMLSRLRAPGSRACLRRPFPLAALLRSSTDAYYAYRGSLTTPPCSEAVTWLVFPDPLYISYSQIKKFRRLKSDENVHLLHNYRFPQPLNNRIVYKRNARRYNTMGTNLTQVDTLKWAYYQSTHLV